MSYRVLFIGDNGSISIYFTVSKTANDSEFAIAMFREMSKKHITVANYHSIVIAKLQD